MIHDEFARIFESFTELKEGARVVSVNLDEFEIEIIMDLLDEYKRELESLDALQFQPSEESLIVRSLQNKIIKADWKV